MIDVVDVFAGPGGLAEGFASYRDSRGEQQFKIALSIERDAAAHSTLRLRAFQRIFNGELPREYYSFIRGDIDWGAIASAWPKEAKQADSEAIQLELSRQSAETVRGLVTSRIQRDRPWVLIGGPPCQAYSLVGRSRNRGNVNYRPSRDRRNSLYIEYLQILADHAPPVFVMENVKGLLSAQSFRTSIFERILGDLASPSQALEREGRSKGRRRPRYCLVPLTVNGSTKPDAHSRFVVRAEEFGVPQRRHRVIIVGIRADIAGRPVCLAPEKKAPVTAAKALVGLPALRSGLSNGADSGEEWADQVSSALRSKWFATLDAALRAKMKAAVDCLKEACYDRGAEYMREPRRNLVLNHTSRGHIVADLHRYLFASTYASVRGESPSLAKFPKPLLPAHLNVDQAIAGKLFGDRFRVQVAERPATTVASHISKDGHYYIHFDPSQCRSLTVREAARLQTFDDDYFFTGPRTAQYHQVGNAVPPTLARQIAAAVAPLCGG